jgi:agmatinase
MAISETKKKQLLKKKITAFNPSDKSAFQDNLFGLPFDIEESDLVILPVPWGVTTENDNQTDDNPEKVLNISHKTCLNQEGLEDAWKSGMAMHNIPQKWQESSHQLKKTYKKIIKANGRKLTPAKQVEKLNDFKNINFTSKILNEWVEAKCKDYLKENKVVGLLGGDGSINFGLINSLSRKYREFSILHLDALPDLKNKHQGFEYSNRSNMLNALKFEQIDRIVHAGLRAVDYDEEEFISNNRTKNRIFTEKYIRQRQFRGATWKILANEIISALHRNVYVSVDMNIFQHWLSPNTTTQIPGGFTLEEILLLFEEIHGSKRKIIGFDINETGSSNADTWDATVTAELLFNLSSRTILTNKVIKRRGRPRKK